MAVRAAAFILVFFVFCFLALCFGAGCAACADGSLEDGAGTASAAQAGTTIKANNNSIKFFMITSPRFKDSCDSPHAKAARQQQTTTKPAAVSPSCMLTRPV
ncbi:MAG: hypothetical protein ACM3W8_01310 [Sideroxydans sp.]